MALSFVSGTRRVAYLGDRKVVYGSVDEVTNSGDEVSKATLGMSSIDSAVVTCSEATVAVQATINSNDGTRGSSNGDLYLITASGTHDVEVFVIGR